MPVTGVLSSVKTLEDILTEADAEVGYGGYLGKRAKAGQNTNSKLGERVSVGYFVKERKKS